MEKTRKIIMLVLFILGIGTIVVLANGIVSSMKKDNISNMKGSSVEKQDAYNESRQENKSSDLLVDNTDNKENESNYTDTIDSDKAMNFDNINSNVDIASKESISDKKALIYQTAKQESGAGDFKEDYVDLPEPDKYKPSIEDNQNGLKDKGSRKNNKSHSIDISSSDNTQDSSGQEKNSDKNKNDSNNIIQDNKAETEDGKTEEDIILTEDFVILTEGLNSNGELIYDNLDDFSLPTKVLIGLKNTGENSGEINDVEWTAKNKNDIESVQQKRPGEYYLIAKVKEDFNINNTEYKNINFSVKVIIK